jgi:hypothetical protein
VPAEDLAGHTAPGSLDGLVDRLAIRGHRLGQGLDPDLLVEDRREPTELAEDLGSRAHRTVDPDEDLVAFLADLVAGDELLGREAGTLEVVTGQP